MNGFSIHLCDSQKLFPWTLVLLLSTSPTSLFGGWGVDAAIINHLLFRVTGEKGISCGMPILYFQAISSFAIGGKAILLTSQKRLKMKLTGSFLPVWYIKLVGLLCTPTNVLSYNHSSSQEDMLLESCFVCLFVFRWPGPRIIHNWSQCRRRRYSLPG